MKTKSVVPLYCRIALVLAASAWPLTAAATPVLPVLIRVNVSTPSAVTFSATGEMPAFDDDSTTTLGGVTLIDFFPGVIVYNSPTGNLSPAGTTEVYDIWDTPFTDGLNLYAAFGNDVQDFSTAAAAFSGVAEIDLAGSELPLPGASGVIVLANQNENGRALGQWVAVPEPSAFLYGGLISVLAGCGYRIKRRLAVS